MTHIWDYFKLKKEFKAIDIFTIIFLQKKREII